MGVEPKEI
jgi:Protein kinase domain